MTKEEKTPERVAKYCISLFVVGTVFGHMVGSEKDREVR